VDDGVNLVGLDALPQRDVGLIAVEGLRDDRVDLQARALRRPERHEDGAELRERVQEEDEVEPGRQRGRHPIPLTHTERGHAPSGAAGLCL
jgi:hypothetical protein